MQRECTFDVKAALLHAAGGFVAGVMVIWGILTAATLASYGGGETFAGWLGSQITNLLTKPGTSALKAAYGEDTFYELSGIIVANRVLLSLVLPGGVMGLVVGLIAYVERLLVARSSAVGAALGVSAAVGGIGGVICALVVSTKGMIIGAGLLAGAVGAAALYAVMCIAEGNREEDDPRLPAGVPLLVAGVGVAWHGYVMGPLSLALLGFAKKKKALRLLTWVVAFVAVLVWAWAMQASWEEGWSKKIPYGLKHIFYWLGHLAGLKE